MNKGITLIETLVAIVIVGIVGTFMLLIFADKSKIDAKTITNYNAGEIIKSEFEMFSYDPDGYKQFYTLESNVQKVIYYGGKFEYTTNKETNNFMLITFVDKTDNGGYYKLTIETYIDGQLKKVNNSDSITRSVYGG